MSNKKKTTPLSPIQRLIAYASPKENKNILSLPVSETENIDIEVKMLLSADEMVSFVAGIADAVFVDDQYFPSLYNLVFAKAIIVYYTDLGVMFENDDLVKIVYDSPILKLVLEKINQAQLKDIKGAIVKLIEFKKSQILSCERKQLSDVTAEVIQCTEKYEELLNVFSKIDISEAFDLLKKTTQLNEADRTNNILEYRSK